MQIRITSYDTPPVKFTLAGTYKEGHDKLAISTSRGVQKVGFLRAQYKTNLDRGNAEVVINFTTSRTFTSYAEAETYAADLDSLVPVVGRVELQFWNGNSFVRQRVIENAAIPQVNVTHEGCTLVFSFTIYGGAMLASAVRRG